MRPSLFRLQRFVSGTSNFPRLGRVRLHGNSFQRTSSERQLNFQRRSIRFQLFTFGIPSTIQWIFSIKLVKEMDEAKKKEEDERRREARRRRILESGSKRMDYIFGRKDTPNLAPGETPRPGKIYSTQYILLISIGGSHLQSRRHPL